MTSLGIAALAGGIWAVQSTSSQSPNSHQVTLGNLGVTTSPSSTSKYAASGCARSSFGEFPVRSGWPVRLPGQVASTPIVADLLGDGKLEVVATCRASADPLRHIVKTSRCFTLFMWMARRCRAGQSSCSRTIRERRRRVRIRGMRGQVLLRCFVEMGRTSSSDGRARRGCARHRRRAASSAFEDGATGRIVWRRLADLDGDGTPDISIGQFVGNVDGQPVAGWPNAAASQRLQPVRRRPA